MCTRTVTIIILGFYTILAGKSHAQLYLGGKMGAYASTLNFDDNSYQRHYRSGLKPGIAIGGAFDMKVTKSFDLYGELVYSIKGASIKSKENSGIRNRLSLSYFDFPLLLRTNIYKNSQANLFFQMGPTIGYWLKGNGVVHAAELDEYNLEKAKYKVKWAETTGLLNEVYVAEANRVQLSLNLGFGSQIKLRHHLFIVDVRYEMGHTHLSRSIEKLEYLGSGYSMDFKANSSSVIFSTAYLFNVDALRRQIRR